MNIPLSDAQAQALLSDKSNKAKPVAKKVLSYLNASAAFMLANGNIIYYQQGYYQLDFDSFFALIMRRESVFTTNHNYEYFITNHSVHLNDFKQYFTGYYDFSIASLESIDRDYSRLVKSGTSEATLFLPLVCYAAEVFIQQTNGHWGEDPVTSNAAAIIDKDGKVYDPYFCIRKILVNKHKPHSIESVLTSQLQ